jgi:hypothetical protein
MYLYGRNHYSSYILVARSWDSGLPCGVVNVEWNVGKTNRVALLSVSTTTTCSSTSTAYQNWVALQWWLIVRVILECYDVVHDFTIVHSNFEL